MRVIADTGSRPIKAWTQDIEDKALTQVKNLATLPFIADNGIALMPDVHAGIGSSVGTVIATDKAIIPAAVGVDIGCGMNAVRTTLKATDLPDSLLTIRRQIERDVPLGPNIGVNNLVAKIKGYTASTLRKEFPELRSRLPSLWTRSRFIVSVGTVQLEVVRKYIENQKHV